MTPPDRHLNLSALEDYFRAVDFDQGRAISHARHHQGEVRLFAPQDPHLPDRLIVKRPKGTGLRQRLALKSLRREHRAYQRLKGLDGVAPCHGLVFDQYLVLAFVEGVPLSSASPPPERFYTALLQTIQAMHQRGVAHGDLKKKDNILITPDGHPVIVDLGTAVLQKPGWHPLNHRLFDLIKRTDLNAWVKHKYGGYAGVDSVDQRYLNRSWPERVLTAMRARKRSKP
mgnify:FL=1